MTSEFKFAGLTPQVRVYSACNCFLRRSVRFTPVEKAFRCVMSIIKLFCVSKSVKEGIAFAAGRAVLEATVKIAVG
jgi:hypothetical protein